MARSDNKFGRDDRMEIELTLLSMVDDIIAQLKEVGHYEGYISFDTRELANPCRTCKYGVSKGCRI